MSDKPSTLVNIKRANLYLRRARFVTYVILIALLGYYKWRYDLVRLPEGGLSPLEAFDPGTRLIVDVQTQEFSKGDAVFYRLPDGAWLLGRVQSPPASAPKEIWDAWDAGALWIVKERPECPGDDSLRLGPIATSDVIGRVCGSVPW